MYKFNNFSIYIFKVSLSVLILAYLLNQIAAEELVENLKKFSLTDLILPVVLYIFAHFLNAIKLNLIIQDRSVSEITRFTFIALFYGTALPGQILGDVVKAYSLIRPNDNSAEIISIVLFDKITGLLSLTILTVLGLILMPEEISPIFIALSLVLLVILILIVFSSNILFILLQRLSLNIKINKNFLYSKKLSLKNIFISIILGFCFQIISVLIIRSLGHALGIEISIFCWFSITGLLSIVLILPMSLAGIGIRELTLITLLGLVGVPSSEAFILSILLLFLTLFGALIGFILDILNYKT